MEIKYGENTVNLKPPWRRVTLRDAVKEHSGIDFVTYPTASGLRERMRSLNIEVDPDYNWAKLVDELLKTLRQAEAHPANDRLRLPGVHVAAGQEQARRGKGGGALPGLRGRQHRARQRLQRAQRPHRAAGAVRGADERAPRRRPPSSGR